MESARKAPTRAFTVSLALTAFITPLAVHLFFPVIPAVKVALALSDAYAQLTFSIALFGMAFATLFYGSLSDRYGRRPVLLSGLALFLVGSVLSALAPTAETLVLGRLIQAIGAGCSLTLVRAIARDAFRAEQLVKTIAYLTMFGTLGPMVSPFIGGVLIDTLGWRSVFGFALLAGGAITLTAFFVLVETHPEANRNTSGESVAQSYVALFSRLRFNAFVLTSGFNTGAFMVMASAAASLMTELLHRPATEFGMYFLLFPIGFFTGNFISTRIGNRLSTEAMVTIGSLVALASVTGQAIALESGWVTPLAFFIPGTFITMAQGLSMPYGQVGAMAEIPRFAGTAAGVGVFMQNFGAAVFSQLYGVFADGTPRPMVVIAVLCGVLTLIFGALPLLQKRFGTVPPPG
ncbi:MAG: multidrug effflux MFS transporter [Hyphomicrobiales bacterium]|nr:multidrug effflux MFS transporter [Alphaproteobacteria bacterium]